MNEKIFNLYSIVQRGFLTHVGIKTYYASGTEKEKQRILIERAEKDYLNADIYTIAGNRLCVPFLYEDDCQDKTISYAEYRQMDERALAHIFAGALQDKEASMSSLINISLVIDGKFMSR